MNDHKAWCCCKRCEDARQLLKSLRPKRSLPPGVREQWLSKKAKEEEEMLVRGYILFQCPECGHRAWTKISRQMKCGCCCKVFE